MSVKDLNDRKLFSAITNQYIIALIRYICMFIFGLQHIKKHMNVYLQINAKTYKRTNIYLYILYDSKRVKLLNAAVIFNVLWHRTSLIQNIVFLLNSALMHSHVHSFITKSDHAFTNIYTELHCTIWFSQSDTKTSTVWQTSGAGLQVHHLLWTHDLNTYFKLDIKWILPDWGHVDSLLLEESLWY